MNTEKTTHASDAYVAAPQPIPYERLGFGWGAVLAGLAIAIALNIFFAEIGLWMNLGIVDSESSGGTVLAVNAIAWVVTGLIALYAGSWVAGRMASARTTIEGGVHGLAVWAAGAVVMLLLAFSAAGVIGGGMIAVVGKGLEGAGQLAEVAAPSWDTIREEIDGALVQSEATAGAAADTRIRDRSRIFELAGQHFSLESGPLEGAEREELVGLIASRTDLSKSAAEQTLAQWDSVWNGTVEQYEAAKAGALEVAAEARRTTMVAAAWAAVGMLLSAAAAIVGGAHGARSRLRIVTRNVVGYSERMNTPTLPFTGRSGSGHAQPIG